MGAYVHDRPAGRIISIASGNSALSESTRPGEEAVGASSGGISITDRLEAFVHATRQLEAALAQERNRSRRIQEEFHQAKLQFERQLGELDLRNKALAYQADSFKSSIAKYQTQERELLAKCGTIAEELRKVRTELNHYKAAWAGVLERESEAKMIIGESEANRKKLQELQSAVKELRAAATGERDRANQAERHARSYQAELQNALVRLHSAESKFNELNKELQALNHSKRAVDEEIAKIEASMKERLHWAALKEREKIRAELEKEAALERERVQSESSEKRLAFEREIYRLNSALDLAHHEASTARSEAEEAKRELKERLADAEARIEATRSACDERLRKVAVESIRGSSEATELRERAESLQAEVERLTAELEREKAAAQAQKAELESERILLSQSKAQVEQLKAELARGQHRIQALQAELEQAKGSFDKNTQSLKAILDEAREKLSAAEVRASQAQGKGQELGRQLEAGLREKGELRRAYEAEAEKARSLEAALLAEKKAFDARLDELCLELEEIRAIHPLQNLLHCAESELCESLHEEVRQYSEKLDLELQKLENARETDVIMTEPGKEDEHPPV